MENAAWAFDESLDSEFLNALYGDDTDHAVMVFNEFLKIAPEMMIEIDESYQKREIENFRQKLHKVKPVFSFVGLTHLTKKAETLEYKCKDATIIGELSALYEDLKLHFNNNFPIVEQEAKRLENQKLVL